MANFQDFLLNALSGALETVGESKLDEVLQQLYKDDPVAYKAAIFGGNELVKALLPVTSKTGTKIDDAILKALSEAITQSAAVNGITL